MSSISVPPLVYITPMPFFLLMSIALYSYRIAVEEKSLLVSIGEPCRAFMVSRKRLIPHVY